MRNLIPKRINYSTRYLKSREYEERLRIKFGRWTHIKVARVYYTMFNITYFIYAKDWFHVQRTKTMQRRAQAMFDAMTKIIKMRMAKVPPWTKLKARREALFLWAKRQQEVDGRKYLVKDFTIVPIQKL